MLAIAYGMISDELVRIGHLLVDAANLALHQLSRTWEDWMKVAEAVAFGRALAMSRTCTNKPRGMVYNDAFWRWVRETKFDLDRMDAPTRSRLMTLFEHRADVEAWRATLTPAQRVAWNGPEVVLRR